MDKQFLAKSLREHEGFVPHAYQDNLGYWTIGIGRLIDKNGGGITEQEALYLLNNDIDRVMSQVYTQWPWAKKSPDGVQYALCHMVFQMGLSGVLKFKKTLELLEKKCYNEAADNALKSKWAIQTPNRARFVTDLMRIK